MDGAEDQPPGNGSGNGRAALEEVPALASPVPHTVPMVRSAIVSSKRGGWMSELSSDTVVPGDTLFRSSHVTVDTGPLPVVQPSFKRSNPFAGMEGQVNTTIFTSSHRGEMTGAAPAEATAGQGEESANTPARGGRKKASAASAGKTGAGSAGKTGAGGGAKKSPAARKPRAAGRAKKTA